MVIENTTGILSNTYSSVSATLKALAGGIIFVYVLIIILKWYETRRLLMIMKDIRHDIRAIGKKIDAKGISRPRKERLKQTFENIKKKR